MNDFTARAASPKTSQNTPAPTATAITTNVNHRPNRLVSVFRLLSRSFWNASWFHSEVRWLCDTALTVSTSITLPICRPPA